jgi:hypothetical protein
MSKSSSFVEAVWEALHPEQRCEERRRWVPPRDEPRWKRIEARRREERRVARIEARRLLKAKGLTHIDWQIHDYHAKWCHEATQWARVETRRFKREQSQRFALDRGCSGKKSGARNGRRRTRTSLPGFRGSTGGGPAPCGHRCRSWSGPL